MGVIGFTRTLAADVGRYNITVNAICPGVHEARSLELARARAEYRGEPFDDETFRSRFRARQQDSTAVIAGRWCADEGYTEKSAGPGDAASIAVFLASDEAANFTGQDINSGGYVMW
jgi:NAD(P)-dependent dehydrogenase (short-subunit alcohol dehydrogenase family)